MNSSCFLPSFPSTEQLYSQVRMRRMAGKHSPMTRIQDMLRILKAAATQLDWTEQWTEPNPAEEEGRKEGRREEGRVGGR